MKPDSNDSALRLANAADRHAVEKIVHDAYAHYIARLGCKPGPMLDDYKALILSGRIHIFERQGLIQGIIVLIPRNDAMLLDNVAVAPAVRGTGVGRTLLRFAERAAIEAGFGRIRLYTNEDMTENIALYRRIGYAETHRTVENGFRRVYMEKNLNKMI